MQRIARVGFTVVGLGIFAIGGLFLFASNSAEARPQYLKAFGEKYPKLKSKADKAKCNICHEGPQKKNRNEYGKALIKELGEDEKNVMDADKIKESLEKLEAKDSPVKGKTFGSYIKDGELPPGKARGGKKGS